MIIPEILQHYLNLGWYLFPLKAKSKIPLTPSGFKDASNDVIAIAKWISQYPGCNWAVATGASKLLVVDLDIPKGGTKESLEAAIADNLPYSACAYTGGGGIHIVYTRDVLDMPTKLSLLKGVDILAATGYIVVAPSIHPNGKPYQWQQSPWEVAPVSLDNIDGRALLDYLKAASKPAKTVTKPLQNNATEIWLGPGDGRWDKLRMFAGRLRSWGWSYESIAGAIEVFAQNQVERDDTVTASKLRALVKFVCDKPAGNTKVSAFEVAMEEKKQKLEEHAKMLEARRGK